MQKIIINKIISKKKILSNLQNQSSEREKVYKINQNTGLKAHILKFIYIINVTGIRLDTQIYKYETKLANIINVKSTTLQIMCIQVNVVVWKVLKKSKIK